MAAAEPMEAKQEEWEVLWCFEGFQVTADRLQQRLPSWCRFRRVNPAMPLAEQVAGAHVLIPTAARISPDVLDRATHLRLICQAGTGHDTIDVEACRARNIPVCNCPGLNATSVAEAALCALLAMAKNLAGQAVAFEERRPGVTVGVQLAGKTMGIIGMGAIGKAMEQIAMGMSMTVVSTSSTSSRKELEQLLRSSDVVSLSCPLNDATRGLISHKELAMMKHGSYLLNFARGAIIDRQALVDHLESAGNRLAGVALDVHWEPLWDPFAPPYNHPCVLALPYNAFATGAVFDGYADLIVQNIRTCREGGNTQLVHRL
mmetsp:Transcript_10174/g.26237  ORF Transcript_10174/g.26237 Transcript_10174/m.26237 type:complete len:317 (-) Transcript_10174:145-1095(-)